MPTPTICQVCGCAIKGKVYFWSNDYRLPMHPSLMSCGPNASQAFADFMNRNANYINQQSDPVLLSRAPV